MVQERTILTVDQILKNYQTNQQIPAALNNRPYDFDSETDERGFSRPKDFDGNFARETRIDLFKAVSRESRESAAQKAQLSSTPTAAPVAPAQPAAEGAAPPLSE